MPQSIFRGTGSSGLPRARSLINHVARHRKRRRKDGRGDATTMTRTRTECAGARFGPCVMDLFPTLEYGVAPIWYARASSPPSSSSSAPRPLPAAPAAATTTRVAPTPATIARPLPATRLAGAATRAVQRLQHRRRRLERRRRQQQQLPVHGPPPHATDVRHPVTGLGCVLHGGHSSVRRGVPQPRFGLQRCSTPTPPSSPRTAAGNRVRQLPVQHHQPGPWRRVLEPGSRRRAHHPRTELRRVSRTGRHDQRSGMRSRVRQSRLLRELGGAAP